MRPYRRLGAFFAGCRLGRFSVNMEFPLLPHQVQYYTRSTA